MYKRGIRERKLKEKKIERLKQEKERTELNFSFKPSINPVSKEIIKASNRNKSKSITDNPGELKETIKNRSKLRMEEKHQCTFTPLINKHSTLLATSRNQFIAKHYSSGLFQIRDKFEFLFADSIKRRLHNKIMLKYTTWNKHTTSNLYSKKSFISKTNPLDRKSVV